VPAVCLIAGILNDFSNVIKVIQTCFRIVQNSERLIGTPSLNPGNTTLIRCLYLLGLVAQHTRIDQRSEQFTSALGVPRNTSVTGLIAKLLAVFTKPIVPETLRKIAVTSYGIPLKKTSSDCRVFVSWKYRVLQIGNRRSSADNHIFLTRWVSSSQKNDIRDFPGLLYD